MVPQKGQDGEIHFGASFAFPLPSPYTELGFRLHIADVDEVVNMCIDALMSGHDP